MWGPYRSYLNLILKIKLSKRNFDLFNKDAKMYRVLHVL